jgi:RNA polymerase sigma factor (sigma-70 family)
LSKRHDRDDKGELIAASRELFFTEDNARFVIKRIRVLASVNAVSGVPLRRGMKLQGNAERVKRFRDGDRNLLEKIYRSHVDAVERLVSQGFSFSSRGVAMYFQGFRQPFDVQEAIQEGFLRAFREKARVAYDIDKPFRPYLLMIVRNAIIDRFRRERRHQKAFVLVGDLSLEQESSQQTLDRLSATLETQSEASPERIAMRQELGQVLASFLGGLEDIDRRIVNEHLSGSLTQEEMAKSLGQDRNEVRKRIRHIRLGLLRHMKRARMIGGLDVNEALQVLLIALATPHIASRTPC